MGQCVVLGKQMFVLSTLYQNNRVSVLVVVVPLTVCLV